MKKTLKTKIEEVMTDHPNVRGDKNALIKLIWLKDIPSNLLTDEVYKVLDMLADGELSSAETIMRTQRKMLESRDSWRATANYKTKPKPSIDDVIKKLGK